MLYNLDAQVNPRLSAGVDRACHFCLEARYRQRRGPVLFWVAGAVCQIGFKFRHSYILFLFNWSANEFGGLWLPESRAKQARVLWAPRRPEPGEMARLTGWPSVFKQTPRSSDTPKTRRLCPPIRVSSHRPLGPGGQTPLMSKSGSAPASQWLLKVH